jgi:4-hydroxy-3-methylbut-2-enyl diphosphate reductase
MASRHRTSPGLVVLCALPPEAVAAWVGIRLFERRSPERAFGAWQGAVRGGRVRLTGMGPSRARRAASQLASSLPDGLPVVVVGVGGALAEGFSAGNLVVASQLGTADVGGDGELEVVRPPSVLDERSQLLAREVFEALSGRFPSTSFAPLLSAGRTARGSERGVLARSGAVICDTESVWLARLAERRPFAVVRSIVDTPERELVSLQTVTGGVKGLQRLAAATEVIAEVLIR